MAALVICAVFSLLVVVWGLCRAADVGDECELGHDDLWRHW
jgi:hypothetical protein